MQYIEELLKAKRLDVNHIITSPCRVTIKEDGCAFQVSYDPTSDKLIFGKRSNNNKRVDKPIINIDLLLNSIYYDAAVYLMEFKNIIEEYDILNFELLSINDKHIIHYNNIDDTVKIILLSGYKNGLELTQDDLKNIAKKMSIYIVECVEDKNLPNNIINTLNDKSSTSEDIFNIFYNVYIHDSKIIEGFVIEFFVDNKTRYYKVQNPEFVKKLKTHLVKEKESKISDNLEDIYEYIINSYKNSEHILKTHDKLLRLFYLWYSSLKISHNKEVIDKIKKLSQINKISISENFLEKQYPFLYKIYINKTEDEKILLKFIILAFQNKRVKNPLWCSLDFQINYINPFLETKLFKNL